MVRLRHGLNAIVAALLAVAAVLIVTTVATAGSPPVSRLTMSMTQQGPCEDMKDGKAPCTPHCAVLCQALIGVAPHINRTPLWSQARYDETPSVLSGRAYEADDPPPRTRIR